MQNLESQVSRIVARVDNNKKISKKNRTVVHEYHTFLRAEGKAPRTILKHLRWLNLFLESLGRDIDVTTSTRQDVEKALAKIEGMGYEEETKRHIKAIIKAFYRHVLGEGEYYPKQVGWVKTTMKRSNRKMLPEDLLTEGDVLKMLGACTEVRDKAIIALLFDSGIRLGELVGLRRKDLDLDSNPAHVVVNGKTGMRRIPILFSVPYLAQYINVMREMKHEDNLWRGIGNWKNKTPTYFSISSMLKNVAKGAGIQKRVYPHLFRHSRATYYANKLTEQQLKVFFGWTGDSRMASTYVHMSGRDIDNAVLQAHGITPRQDAAEPQLKSIACPKCRYDNAVDAVYCTRCGSALDIQVAMKESEGKFREAFKESLKDPKVIEDIVHLYLDEQRKKRKK